MKLITNNISSCFTITNTWDCECMGNRVWNPFISSSWIYRYFQFIYHSSSIEGLNIASSLTLYLFLFLACTCEIPGGWFVSYHLLFCSLGITSDWVAAIDKREGFLDGWPSEKTVCVTVYPKGCDSCSLLTINHVTSCLRTSCYKDIVEDVLRTPHTTQSSKLDKNFINEF